MLQEITKTFDALAALKLEFKPPIPVKADGNEQKIWIDKMYKVKDVYMLTISTENDNMNRKLEYVEERVLIALKLRFEAARK